MRNRTRYECLLQWLKDHPEKAAMIARDAIWGLYGEGENIPDDPMEREFPSGADYQSFVDESIAAAGGIDVLMDLRKPRYNKVFPEVTHWIVSGRIPYDEEDSTFHVVVPKGSSPSHEFAVELYKCSGRKLPKNYEEESSGEWFFINSETELHGPPV